MIKKYRPSPPTIPAKSPIHIEPIISRELKYQPWDHNSFVVIWLKSTIFLSEFKKVEYKQINYNKRVGESKIHPIKDTLNFVILILKVIIYFNPLKVFIPLSLVTFFIGVLLILYRALIGSQFLVTSIIFLFFATNFLFLGLIAELINKRK